MRNLIRLLLALAAALAALSLLDAERRTPVRRPAGGGTDEEEEPSQCEAVTQSGVRCRRPTEPGSDYCWQHGG